MSCNRTYFAMHQLLRSDSDLCGYTASALVLMMFSMGSMRAFRQMEAAGAKLSSVSSLFAGLVPRADVE